jgi:hypothetical protein
MPTKAKTKAEKEIMAKIADLGCIICGNNLVELHHITTLRGFGGRSKHNQILPLCFLHHRGGQRGVALHEGVKTWEDIHGTQESLLEKVNEQLGLKIEVTVDKDKPKTPGDKFYESNIGF